MSFLDRESTVAGPGYNRWFFPPAALAVHLSIGQVYAFSVFKIPLVEHFDSSLTAIGAIVESTKDPKYVVVPQRERMAARAAQEAERGHRTETVTPSDKAGTSSPTTG